VNVCCIENEQFDRFSEGEDLKILSSSRSCERQESLVIPALSYINMHLIIVFTLLLA
jgi:hypothetical protein